MDDDRGKLVAAGFYIEPRDYNVLNFLLSWIIVLFSIQMIIFVSILFGFYFDPQHYWIIALLTLAIGCFMLPLILETRSAYIVKSGALDWDYYEYGILVKEFRFPGALIPEDVSVNRISVPPPWKQLVHHFVRFDEICKIYFSEDSTQTDECVRMFFKFSYEGEQSFERKTPDEKSPNWESARNYLGETILVEGKGGRLLLRPIVRKNLKDMTEFERLLRQKVMAVE